MSSDVSFPRDNERRGGGSATLLRECLTCGAAPGEPCRVTDPTNDSDRWAEYRETHPHPSRENGPLLVRDADGRWRQPITDVEAILARDQRRDAHRAFVAGFSAASGGDLNLAKAEGAWDEWWASRV